MSQLPSQRHLFDVPDDVSYFNSATNSPLLRNSLNRLVAGAAQKSLPWQRTPEKFFNDAETIRSLSAKLFGGDRDGYATIPAASYGISSAARAIEPELTADDTILLIDEDFPSNVLPWRRAAMETGAKIKTVPTPTNGNWSEAILGSIKKGIKVVAISSCHWTNGAYIDLKAIGTACRAVDAIFVIDATQTLAAVPFSVEEIKPDFLVAAGYKWLLSPYGFGLLYVSERWYNARPLEETWLGRDNAENFAELVNYSDNYLPGARRFEMGEKCIPTILPGAIAALEQIDKWGIQNIAYSLASINATIIEELTSLGFKLFEPDQRNPHMFGAVLPDGYEGDLISELVEQKIFITKRGNAMRFSPHLHVNDADVDRLISNLRRCIAGH